MREFPKMLYVGSTQSHKHQVAQNEDHEAELRGLGFVDFADLESEHAGKIEVDEGVIPPYAGVDAEIERLNQIIEESSIENDELKNKLSTLDKAYSKAIDDFSASNEKFVELAEKFGEEQNKHFEFQNNVGAMKARIAEIQGDTTPVGTVSESPDYNSLTTPQLQKLLDEKGIAYLKRDDKATLLALLTQPVKTEE